MDGLELNLFKSENATHKKKTIGKSKKKFLKKKLNQSKRGAKDKSKTKKKAADKKEIDQNKEISTIQDEFSSGLEVKKVAKPTEKRQDAGKRVPVQRLASKKDPAKKSGGSKATTKSEQLKNKPAKKEHQASPTNESIRPAKSTNPIVESVRPSTSSAAPNNLAISMINDEFSDGLTGLNPRPSLKRKSDEDEHRSGRQLKRPNHQPNQQQDRRSERPPQRHCPNNLSAEELKSDFNKMFSSKGKIQRLAGEEAPNRSKFESSGQRFRRDEQQPRERVRERARDRNEFISNCFESNPEIPEVRLRTLAEENKEGVFQAEDESFDSLKDRIHPHLISCLAARQGITKMTNVQSKSIPVILDGFDCLVKSVTGSGKTLAYVIPIIQRLQAKEPKISRNDGIYALIIVPTRELVMQCYSLLESLCKVGEQHEHISFLHLADPLIHLSLAGLHIHRTLLSDGRREQALRKKPNPKRHQHSGIHTRSTAGSRCNYQKFAFGQNRNAGHRRGGSNV